MFAYVMDAIMLMFWLLCKQVVFVISNFQYIELNLIVQTACGRWDLLEKDVNCNWKPFDFDESLIEVTRVMFTMIIGDTPV